MDTSKLRGTTLAAFRIESNTNQKRGVIIQRIGPRSSVHPALQGVEFVVSGYIEGSSEWINGHYFETWSEAVECFADMVSKYAIVNR